MKYYLYMVSDRKLFFGSTSIELQTFSILPAAAALSRVKQITDLLIY
ncbi:hypothetical protein [Psychromonas aquimarina]|nr:hypothetical protein [Psychromonas aquimarina]